MAVTTNNQVIVNKITKALYDANVANGTITAEEITNQIWHFTDDQFVSADDLAKLAGIEAGAEVNIIEGVNVNGVAVSPNAKVVNIVVPTKTSDLTNDSGFITAADIPDVTETDPTVPAWAKASSKPTYTYAEITEKPELFSGNYNDLTNKPDLFSGSYNDLSDKPTLFSGNYNDLTNKPTIPSIDGLASETYVDTKVANLVNSAPTTLDTLGEVATAIQNNATVVDALNSAIGNKANASDVTALATRVSTAESEIDALQSGKADASAIPTKLSDLTNDLNLSAYSNVIETVKVNGTALTPTDKAVNVEVPTCKTRIWS